MASIFPPVRDSPQLPEFKSLIVKGAYHPSAPIHFCLSRPESTAILLSPSGGRFTAALEEFNDAWLNDHGGNGAVASSLSRIKILLVLSPHFI